MPIRGRWHDAPQLVGRVAGGIAILTFAPHPTDASLPAPSSLEDEMQGQNPFMGLPG
jgi:hypothetical protein